MISIKGLDKADVLVALYNSAKPSGIGKLISRIAVPFTYDRARVLVQGDAQFDYLGGRSLKVDLRGDTFDERLYDRDNGDGAARRALQPLGFSDVGVTPDDDRYRLTAR